MKTDNTRAIIQEQMQQKRTAIAPPEIPPVISKWMARLKLLYGLPFNYLVPDEKMLPVESIRFFQLDHNWLQCLEDGAFSIGRSTTGEFEQDQLTQPHVRAAVMQQLKEVRKKAVSTEVPVQQITGFIMRSAIIGGWPKLEIEGFSDKQATDKLEILRLSLLSPTVMLCLFNGNLETLVIHEPSEGMHFGVTMPDFPNQPQTSYAHLLRYLTKGNGYEPGKEMPNVPANAVTLPVRNGNKNVLNIAKSAKAIQAALADKNYTGPFTAAEFGLQMVEGVQLGKFNFKDA